MADTTLPVSTLVVLAVAPAVVTGTAAVLAGWLAGARKAAKQLEHWRRREETMRILRWATDKATSDKESEREVALSVLDALDRSKPAMLQPEDQGIIDAVLDATLDTVIGAVEAYPELKAIEMEDDDD